jgi:hypothetical protein
MKSESPELRELKKNRRAKPQEPPATDPAAEKAIKDDAHKRIMEHQKSQRGEI